MPGPVMRIAPKPICPTGRWARFGWDGISTSSVAILQCSGRRRSIADRTARSHRGAAARTAYGDRLYTAVEDNAEAGRFVTFAHSRLARDTVRPCAAWQRVAPEPVSPLARRAERHHSPRALRLRSSAPTPRRAGAASRTGHLDGTRLRPCRTRCVPAGVRAEVRLRSAGSPLVDEHDIAAWGVGGAGLVVGVDGEGTAWPAVDINHGLGKRRLLRAPDDDDRQLELTSAGIVVVPRDTDCAATQARTDLRRDTG